VESTAFFFKANAEKTYRGICIGICGQTYVFGTSLRGWFWRLGGKICTPKPGYSESLFALRTKLLITAGMRDELVSLRIYPINIDRSRNTRIRGIVHASKHGLLTMSFSEMDINSFSQMDSKILEGFTVGQTSDLDTDFYDYEERDRLDSD
jgi:hypothetical protein